MRDRINRIRRRADQILIGLFLACLWLPLAEQWLHLGPRVAQTEKRRPAPFPALHASWTSLCSFPDRFAAYYGDHFGWRAALIRLHARLMYEGWGASPSRFVVLGRERWLYYADDSSLEDYRSARPFSGAELARWRAALERRRDWLAERGIRFMLVLACDKHVVYPEFMPAAIRRVHAEYRSDQLAGYLRTNSTLDVVYVRPALEAARRTERIYHRTDTHWNDLGAAVGYREIAGRLARWFPAVQPQPATAFDVRSRTTPGLDLAQMMGLEDIVTEEALSLLPRRPRRAQTVFPETPDRLFNDGLRIMETADPALPRMVMFRDSFASALVPLLAEHFSRSAFLWQYEFDARTVEREKPDVVLLLITGRRLQWLSPETL